MENKTALKYIQLNRNKPTIFIPILILILAACAAGGKNPSTDKNTLIFASFQPFGISRETRQAVEQFNRAHYNGVQIEIVDYWGGSYEEAIGGRERLLAEFSTGHVPDILDLGSDAGPVKMLPYRQLVQRGYLEDLRPYIENDPDIQCEDLLEAPLRAAEIDGGLYMLFDSVRLATLAGAGHIVGDHHSWSFADIREAYAAMPEDSTIFEYDCTRSQLFRHILRMDLDGYVDWETGQCRFDCPGFRMTLEFIRSFPEESSAQNDSVETYNHELFWRMAEGRQMLFTTIVNNPGQVQRMDWMLQGRASFIGYPTEDGSTGSAFVPADQRFAMSATCRDKEAAWEFLRERLLPQYRNVGSLMDDLESMSVPVNLADYRLMRQTLMSQGRLSGHFQYTQEGPVIEYHAVTGEEMQRFESWLNSIEKLDLCDGILLDIVEEQSGPYFAGDKTLDETVALIQNRVTLYVNENR